MLLLILAAQVATPPVVAPTAPPAEAAWSILQPVGTEPCVPRAKSAAKPDDIVVCGRPLPSQKLPYPDEVVLDRPKASNPNRTGAGALALAESAPCATQQKGCTTGVDLFGGATQMVRLLQNAVSPGSCCEEPGESRNIVKLGKDIAHGVGGAFRKKPDKSGRVAIALEEQPHESVILP
ncbi:hypothetical protein ABIC16_001687 [Sphingomonas sp. PvP055]|uniref:hypothetical protein n=1 Tax=Sphingomonas sp. PvP055 TaxID=3156391 RepID=UPI00339314FA